MYLMNINPFNLLNIAIVNILLFSDKGVEDRRG